MYVVGNEPQFRRKNIAKVQLLRPVKGKKRKRNKKKKGKKVQSNDQSA